MRLKADTHSEEAEKAVRDIRRATRRLYSAEEKVRIVIAGLRGEDSGAELCRKEGINQNLYYRWSKDFPADAIAKRDDFTTFLFHAPRLNVDDAGEIGYGFNSLRHRLKLLAERFLFAKVFAIAPQRFGPSNSNEWAGGRTFIPKPP